MRIGLPLLLLIGVLAAGSATAEDKTIDRSGNASHNGMARASNLSQSSSSDAGKQDTHAAAGKVRRSDSGGNTNAKNKKIERGETGRNKNDDGNTAKETAAYGKHGKPNADKSTSDVSAPHEAVGKDVGANRIDTSVTVYQGKATGKKNGKLFRNKDVDTKIRVGRTAQDKPFHDNSPNKLQRNAIGTVVVPNNTARQGPPRNAIGLPIATPTINPGSNAGKNAVSAPTVAPAVPSADPASVAAIQRVQNQAEHPPTLTVSGPAPPNPSFVVGTTLVKPAARSGAIAGTPKLAVGVISGNTVHVKHP
jgi:hypothetical protein